MRKRMTSIAIHAALISGCLLMLAPVVWMIGTSLKTFEEILAVPPTWWPASPQWGNYVEAMTAFKFGRYLTNSLIITSGAVAGTLFSCSMAAYAFSCLDCRLGRYLFGALLATMMLPGQVTMIPLFQTYVKLGWINTWWPLLLPHWLGGSVFAIFLLRQFFLGIPRTLTEAARMDGASEPRILCSIYLPLSTPALMTVGVFTFIGAWNDLWGPLLYLHDERLYTLPIGLMSFIGMQGRPEGSPWHLFMAVSAVMMIPIIITFFLAQRRLIEGIALTGVKG